MLTNTTASAILALVFLFAVLANAAAPALLAQAFLLIMLANAAAPALFALVLLFAVLANSRARIQLNPYERFCWNRAAVLQLLAHEDEALPSSRHNKRHGLDKHSERHKGGGQQHVLGERAAVTCHMAQAMAMQLQGHLLHCKLNALVSGDDSAIERTLDVRGWGGGGVEGKGLRACESRDRCV